VDVQFSSILPNIHDALLVKQKNANGGEVIIEVLQILEDGVGRGIAMDSTDGLRRGDQVLNTKSPIQVPVGKEVLGHVFKALGKPLDTTKVIAKKYLPIHRPAPDFMNLSTKQEILET
jgi:F-type H+-transporting ATPase subunit beta